MSFKFRSRVSVLLLAFVLLIAGFSMYVPIQNGETNAIWVGLAVLAIAMVIFFGISYVIEGDNLNIRILGLKYYTINLHDIVYIKRSYIPISSPAASLKRMLLKLRGGKFIPYVLISPVNEDEFLELIRKRNPSVKIDVKGNNSSWNVLDWDL